MYDYYEGMEDWITDAVHTNDLTYLAQFYAGYAAKRLYIALKDYKVAKKLKK